MAFASHFTKVHAVKGAPNVVLFMVDDQDQWDFGAYGNPQVSTPTIDAKGRLQLKLSLSGNGANVVVIEHSQ